MPQGVASGRGKKRGGGSDDRRVTLGGLKLMRFLRKQTPQMSIERFADRAKLRRMSVQRLVNGERWRHLDVNVLIPVIDAAGAMGLRLDFRDFARGTAIPIEDAERQWAPRSRTGV